MSKYLRILLSDDFDAQMYKHLPFCYYLVYNQCKYAGYKQIEKWGLDADYLCKIGALYGPLKTGSYEVLVEPWSFSGDVYYLNVEALFFEKDLATVLRDRNPVWLMSKDEFEKYDKHLYNCLSKSRRQVIDRSTTDWFPQGQLTVQDMLEIQVYRQLKKAFEEGLYDYQPEQLKEYFVNKRWSNSGSAPLFEELYCEVFATKSKKEGVTTSVSNTSEEGSSSQETK